MRFMKRFFKYLIPVLATVVLLGLDQLVKYFVSTHMELNQSIPVIKGVLEIRYIRNSGTAWGMFAGMDMHYFFVVLTLILAAFAVYAYVRFSGDRKYRPICVTLVILFAGAMGNMIDRIVYHEVIDFIYFCLINFPIFNIADIYVVVSMFLLAFFVCFKYEDEDFDVLKPKGKKNSADQG